MVSKCSLIPHLSNKCFLGLATAEFHPVLIPHFNAPMGDLSRKIITGGIHCFLLMPREQKLISHFMGSYVASLPQ